MLIKLIYYLQQHNTDMNIWSKLKNISLLKLYLYLQNVITNRIDFDEFIDVTITLRQIGFWVKKFTFISVDLTELYYDRFNLKRYCFGWINCLLINFTWMTLSLFISNQWLYGLIDNQYLPKNF